MKTIRRLALASMGLLVAAAAAAQGGPVAGQGPRTGPGMPGAGPAASAPGMGPGMQGRAGMGGKWGSRYTPGWSMMTTQERNEHHERMRSMTSHDECKTYLEQHREQMAARAKERGGKALAQPRRDACAGLKP